MLLFAIRVGRDELASLKSIWTSVERGRPHQRLVATWHLQLNPPMLAQNLPNVRVERGNGTPSAWAALSRGR